MMAGEEDFGAVEDYFFYSFFTNCWNFFLESSIAEAEFIHTQAKAYIFLVSRLHPRVELRFTG